MKKHQKLIIVTGLSGAGLTTALGEFNRLGYFCADHLPQRPSALIESVRHDRQLHRAALVVRPRSLVTVRNLVPELRRLIHASVVRVIFMEASTSQLVARFKEHRRFQPLAPDRQVTFGIKKERQLLRPVQKLATVHLNTTHLAPAALRRIIKNNFAIRSQPRFHVDVMSFGFKYGMPLDADLMFDVRFLPNPFYVPSLKHQTGLDRSVYHYVMKQPVTQKFCRKLIDLLEFSIPGYVKEGKPALTIAIGCTGGQHRSVTVARKVAQVLSQKYPVNLSHRDVDKSKGDYQWINQR